MQTDRCPFWKWDHARHYECFGKKIDTIGHLKQHLKRNHTFDFYCLGCLATFKDADAHHCHVLKAKCVKGQSATLTGIYISHDQSKKLERRFQGSDENKWHQIWAILFPNKPPPLSIYLDCDFTEIFCRMMEYSQTPEGASIVRDEILANGGVVMQDGTSDSQLMAAAQRGLHLMFAQFMALNSSSRQSEITTSNEPSGPSSAAGTSHATGHSRPYQLRAIQTPSALSGGGQRGGVEFGFSFQQQQQQQHLRRRSISIRHITSARYHNIREYGAWGLGTREPKLGL